MKTDYLILGGGHAAESAIAGIRSIDSQGTIAMISREAVLPYSRPMLTKLSPAHFVVNHILLHGADWYAENGAGVFLNTEVQNIEPNSKTVCTDRGSFEYRKCIYALGAENFIPPFPGSTLPGVFSIRTNRDIDRIRRYSVDAETAVIIGGGVIGLEAAYMLQERGIAVTVLEAAPYLMPRLLDEAAAVELMNRVTRFTIKAGVKVLGIGGSDRASAVYVEGMSPLPADLVIVSCGIRANTALLQQAGALCERAVVVNDKMETSLQDIYACGDCVQHNGINTALWAQAGSQGFTAGVNAAGGDTRCAKFSTAMLLHCPEFDLYSEGDCGKQSGAEYEITTKLLRQDGLLEVNPRAKDTFLRDYRSNGRLVGTFMIGSLRDMFQKGKEISGNDLDEHLQE